MRILKRLACAVIAAAAFFSLAFAFTGCSVEEAYSKVYDGETFVGWRLDYAGYKNKLSGEVVIPETHGEGEEKKPVVAIADQAFSGSNITAVTVPASVTQIGVAAFAYCNLLAKVTFAEGSQISEITQGAFGYCASLKEITVPKTVNKIGFMSFFECSSLSSVEIPVGVTEISASAFEGCSSLEEVTLPEGLITLGYQAFYRSGLKSVVIPSTVRDTEVEPAEGETEPRIIYGVGYAAFHTCVNLEEVEIRGKIECIPSGAFGFCTSLKRIFLPDSLKEVQGAYFVNGKVYYGHPFHNGYSPLEVYFGGTSQQWAAVKIDDSSTNFNNAMYDNKTLLNAVKHYEAAGLPVSE